MPNNGSIVLKFKLERETKGAVRYQETDNNGNELDIANGAKVGTLYLRKTALSGVIPANLQVTIVT